MLYEVITFNFPEGDTVCLENQAPSYYQLCRDMGRERVWNTFTVVHRPVDKCENYVKRCVGIPGDSIQIVDGQLMVNGKPQDKIGEVQFRYAVLTDGTNLNPKAMQKLGISLGDFQNGYIQPGYYVFPMSDAVAEKMKSFSVVKAVHKINAGDTDLSRRIFPHDSRYKWNEDNFGPIYIV